MEAIARDYRIKRVQAYRGMRSLRLYRVICTHTGIDTTGEAIERERAAIERYSKAIRTTRELRR